MQIHVPPKKVREKFLTVYELQGCQKAVNFLVEYYGVRRIRIVLDGRRVPKRFYGFYFKNRAYFTRRGLKRCVVLHEFYHHLVSVEDLQMPLREEEKEANYYARAFI